MASVPLEQAPAEPLPGGGRRQRRGAFFASYSSLRHLRFASNRPAENRGRFPPNLDALSVSSLFRRCLVSIIGTVKIYTRTGDEGDTGLFDGTRVTKSDPRVAAYGDVDELNAWLGFVRANAPGEQAAAMLEQIQRDLFALGARLADPARKIAERVTKAAITADDVTRLEGWIDLLELELPPLRRFILAGGTPAGASLHVARTVCRRAERAMVGLGPDAFEPELLVYINRLSDLLFVMARAVNHRAGATETDW
jgi:cob(I)alamin adenosyltransferase